jgi:hypothetical protein
VPETWEAENLAWQAQKEAEKHLAACQEALWSEEETGRPMDSPACAPFCGCDTCIVREVLWAAWEILEEAHRIAHEEEDGV